MCSYTLNMSARALGTSLGRGPKSIDSGTPWILESSLYLPKVFSEDCARGYRRRHGHCAAVYEEAYVGML